MPNIKCPECMSEGFEAGVWDIGDLFEGSPVVIKNAAALKCSQCGYLLVPAAIARTITRMLAGGYWHATVPARLYDLAEIDAAQVFAALPADRYTPPIMVVGSVDGSTPEVTPLVRTNTPTVA